MPFKDSEKQRAYARRYNDRFYAARKAGGRCLRCGLPSRQGRQICFACALRAAVSYRERKDATRQAKANA